MGENNRKVPGWKRSNSPSGSWKQRLSRSTKREHGVGGASLWEMFLHRWMSQTFSIMSLLSSEVFFFNISFCICCHRAKILDERVASRRREGVFPTHPRNLRDFQPFKINTKMNFIRSLLDCDSWAVWLVHTSTGDETRAENQPTSCLQLPLRCQVPGAEKIHVSRLQPRLVASLPGEAELQEQNGPSSK